LGYFQSPESHSPLFQRVVLPYCHLFLQ